VGVVAALVELLYGAATVVVPGALMARGMTSSLSSMGPAQRRQLHVVGDCQDRVSVAMLVLATESRAAAELAGVAGGSGAVHEGVLGGAACGAAARRRTTSDEHEDGSETWQPQGNAPTAGEYIIHHLTHLQNKKQTGPVDFSVFNLDSIFFAGG
jgi:hypothetical protein